MKYKTWDAGNVKPKAYKYVRVAMDRLSSIEGNMSKKTEKTRVWEKQWMMKKKGVTVNANSIVSITMGNGTMGLWKSNKLFFAFIISCLCIRDFSER